MESRQLGPRTRRFEADLHDVQVSVVAELARNYFELRGAQWRLAVAQRSLTNQRETLRLTQLRRDAGVGEEQDVASAAARVAAIESTIPSLDFDVSRAEYRLAVLTGSRPGELNADLAPRTYPAIEKALPIGNPGELLQRRPDVRSAERRLAAATEHQGVAVASLFSSGQRFRIPRIRGWARAASFSPQTREHGLYRLGCRGLRSI